VAVVAAVVAAWFVLGRGPASTGEEADSGEAPPSGLRVLTAPDLDLHAIAEGSGEAPDGDDVPVPVVPPSRVAGAIQPGESLGAALQRQGVPPASIHPVVAAVGEIYDFRRAQPGHEYQVELDREGVITTFRYEVSPETVFEAVQTGASSWEARQVEVELDAEEAILSGTVETSFIGAVLRAGESEALANRIVDVLQWDIDFSRDVRPGDAFRVIYERLSLDGEFLRYGDILAIEYRGRRASQTAIRFGDDESAEYYTLEGDPIRRMFLAAPCRYRRISSLFDPNRLHPVLGVRRPHYGVDYAASTGTPVYAVADGTVLFVGVRGGNGNLVRLRHAHGYESGYAHLSRFARGISAGDEVTQGQTIGFVGSTGLSTGPHLHFALKRNGQFIDPLAAENTRGPSLSGQALRDFQRRRAQLLERLDEVRIADVEPELEAEPDVVDETFNEGDFVHDF